MNSCPSPCFHHEKIWWKKKTSKRYTLLVAPWVAQIFCVCKRECYLKHMKIVSIKDRTAIFNVNHLNLLTHDLISAWHRFFFRPQMENSTIKIQQFLQNTWINAGKEKIVDTIVIGTISLCHWIVYCSYIVSSWQYLPWQFTYAKIWKRCVSGLKVMAK